MKEEFVPYEIAIELKRLGFNEECIGSYTENAYGSATKKLQYFYQPIDANDDFVFISTPTFSQTFKWFRVKYKLSSHVDILTQDHLGENYYFKIVNFTDFIDETTTIVKDGYKTYKEAELACINKLINFIK